MKLITSTERPGLLFKRFIAYYSRLGITDFYVVTASKERPQYPVRIHWIDPLWRWNGLNDSAQADLIRQEVVKPDEYYALADEDEFNHIPFRNGFQGLVESLEKEGVDHQMSVFLDRIAADGSIPELREDKSLDEQFPVGAEFTKLIGDGYDFKVVLAKGYLPIAIGHHLTKGGKRAECVYRTHHFKWHGTVLSKLTARLVIEAENPAYVQECRKFLDYFQRNGGRINVAELPQVKFRPLGI